MNDSTVNVRINATDNSKAAIAEAQSNFSGLWKQVSGGVIASQLAFDALNGVRNALDAFKEQAKESQEQQAQLNAAVNNANGAWGVSVQKANELAQALAKKTPIDQESTLAAENQLMTFTKIGKEVFPQATTAVADLATKLNNGAAPSMQQMSDVAIMLGKALDDPITNINALHRRGVEFSEAEKEQIKTLMAHGDQLGAQKIILDEVAKEYGGSATAAAQTFDGQIQILKNHIIDLGGNALIKLEQWLTSTYQWYERNQRVIKDVAQVVIALGGSIMIILTAYKLWQMAIRTIQIAQLALNLIFEMNPIVLIITAIIAIGILLAMHWQQVKQVAETVWNAITGFVSAAWNWIKDHWPLLLGILTGPFGLAVGLIIQHWNDVVGFFRGIPGMIKNAIGNMGSLLYQSGKDMIQGLVNGISDMAGKVFDKVKSIGSEAVSKLKGVLKIFSPSGVFHEIGVNVGAGFIQGIDSTSDDAQESVNSLITQKPLMQTSNPASMINNNNTSYSSYGGDSQTVNIGQITLGDASAVTEFFKQLNNDALLAGKGLAVRQGI